MKKAILISIAMLAIISFAFMPEIKAFVIGPNPSGEDGNYELYGPHVAGIIMKIYADTTTEWTDMNTGHLDIEDWPLDPAWVTTFGGVAGPFTEANYGGEAGYYVIDLNNNATFAPTDAGPFVPNPTSDYFMREAISYAVNRSAIKALDPSVIVIYTPVPSYMAGYINSTISPNGTGSVWTYGGYTGNLATAAAILDAHFFPIDTNTGFRFWDIDHDGDTIQDGNDLPLNLIFYSRSGLRGDYGDVLAADLLSIKVHNTGLTVGYTHVPRSTVTTPVFAQEYFNMYTGGWISIGPDPDFLDDLYDGSNYYHPGSPPNYDGINYADSNLALSTLKTAPTPAIGNQSCWDGQYYLAKHAALVSLWAASGNKDYKNVPVAAGATGNWIDLVNQKGFGVNSWWSTLSMSQNGNLYPNNYTYYGFSSTVTLENIVYNQWYWDTEIAGRIYDGGAGRDPVTLAQWVPQLYKSWVPSLWADPSAGGANKTKVTITLRPDVYWQDGQPLTSADVYYTLVEMSKDMINTMRPGGPLPPPWWYPTVQYMRSVEIIDAYTIEILLDVQSTWAMGWVIGSVVVPKHIWRPIVGVPDGLGGWTVPPTGAANAVQGTRPDPNMIGTGPFRFSSGTGDTVGSTVVIVANKPGSIVNGITSPGYYLYNPLYVDIQPENVTAIGHKINLNPADTSGNIDLSITARNLWYGGNLNVNAYIYNGSTLLNSTTGISLATVLNYPFGSPSADDALLAPFDVEISIEGNMLEIEIGLPVTKKTMPIISADFQIVGGPWAGQWINVTVPLWVTIKYDIAGHTLPQDLTPVLPLYGTVPAFVAAEDPTPDLKVDGKDIALAAKAFGTVPGDARWSAIADVNKDYKVDGKDIALIAKQFGY
jgi:ABC-type transport system substrate-binding protein